MAFDLETPTTAKLLDVGVLSDKDRAPEENPGAALFFSMTVGNDLLTMFDGGLRSALFSKGTAPTLDGIDPIFSELTGIGKAIGQFGWDLELTGYGVTLDHGLGGPKSNIELENCKLTNWKFRGKPGGSVEIKLRIESPDVSERIHGKLALLKTREFQITVTAPKVQQEE